MSHYFDDMLSRSINLGSPKQTKPRMRRSSTARSIGARSDFDVDLDDEDEDARSVADEPVSSEQKAEREAELKEANNHMHQYISDQLERVKSKQDREGMVAGDEFEAHASD